MNAYLDATVLVTLGAVGDLNRLSDLDAEPWVLPAVRSEVTTEPARTTLDRAIETERLQLAPDPAEDQRTRAAGILDAPEDAADVCLLAAVLEQLGREVTVGVVSDDRRVRSVARGLGATVTGTIGVLVRSVDAGQDPGVAREVIRRLDQHGLPMDAGLRSRALELVDEADDGAARST